MAVVLVVTFGGVWIWLMSGDAVVGVVGDGVVIDIVGGGVVVVEVEGVGVKVVVVVEGEVVGEGHLRARFLQRPYLRHIGMALVEVLAEGFRLVVVGVVGEDVVVGWVVVGVVSGVVGGGVLAGTGVVEVFGGVCIESSKKGAVDLPWCSR